MKKKLLCVWRVPPKLKKKLVKTKLILLLSLTLSLPSVASPQKINLNVRNASLKNIFKEIVEQANVYLVYDTEKAEKIRLDAMFSNTELDTVLKSLLANTPLDFDVSNGIYVIVERQQAPPAASSIIAGRVVTESGVPIVGATVRIEGTSVCTITDKAGSFSLTVPYKHSSVLSYPVEVSCLGYQPRSFDVAVTKDTKTLLFQLKETSLSLSEVVVTAKPVAGINTASKINRTAMDHLQATSITDVMQLLPGSLTTNPSLTSAKGNQLSIRETRPSDGNTLGVSIIVDGAPVSNDASLSKDAISTSDKTRSLDMRTISTDNIESVEIIRGVASAEYGDMTSGAIIINTKAGRSPFEIRMKTDPQTKAFALSKGFAVSGDGGFLNVDANYAKAFSDIRTSKDAYDRITATVGYSNTFMKRGNPLNFNVKVNAVVSQENGKPDADDLKKGFVREGYDNSIGVNVFGTWQLGRQWITNVRYSFSGRVGDQYNRDASILTVSSYASTNTEQPGEHAANFLPMQYQSDTKYSSKPVYGNAKLTANLIGSYGKIINKAMLGVEFNTLGNTGDGRTYVGEYTPAGYRPRSFRNIPFMNKYSAFAEDNVTLPLGSTRLELQAGIRATDMSVEGYDNNLSVEPRLNGRYVIFNDGNRKLSHLSIRGGWGISTKSLTLESLFPGNEYTDVNVFSWRGVEREVGVMQTLKATEQMRQNKELKSPESTKIELGTDFSLFGIRGSVVYFNEKERNSLMMYSDFIPVSFRRFYNADASNADKFSPVYEKDANGDYQLVNTAVGGSPFLTAMDDTFLEVSRTGNFGEADKWGVEYTLDFGIIESLRTSVIVSGSYIDIERRSNSSETANYRNAQVMEKKEALEGGEGSFMSSTPYVGIYKGGFSISNGSFSKRLSTNIDFITHIPKLKLITSITLQAVWIDRNQWRNDGGLYRIGDDGERIYGNFYDGSPGTIYKDPVRYMDTDGKYYDFTEESAQDAELKKLINSAQGYVANTFLENSYRPYFMANMRITKEIGRFASMSFYVQNFTNSRPLMRDVSSNSYGRKNTPIYFGAELRLKF